MRDYSSEKKKKALIVLLAILAMWFGYTFKDELTHTSTKNYSAICEIEAQESAEAESREAERLYEMNN